MKKTCLKNGFTLVEILVTLMILSMGFLAFGFNMGNGIKSTRDIQAQRSLSNLTTQVMEHFYALNSVNDLDSIKSEISDFDIETITSVSNQKIFSDIQIIVSLAKDNEGKNLKTVSIENWVKPYTIVYQATIANKPAYRFVQVLP